MILLGCHIYGLSVEEKWFSSNASHFLFVLNLNNIQYHRKLKIVILDRFCKMMRFILKCQVFVTIQTLHITDHREMD